MVKEEKEEDEAYKKAIEDSQLAQWPDLPLALAESAAEPPPSPALEPEQHEPWPPEPLVGHVWSWTSMVLCTPEWVESEPEQQQRVAPTAPPHAPVTVPWPWPFALSAPWPFPWAALADFIDGQ